MNDIEDIKNSLNRIETIMNNEICEFNKPIIEGNLNLIKRYIENLIKENKELKERVKLYENDLEKIDKALNLEHGTAAPYRSDIIYGLYNCVSQLKQIIDNSIPKSKVKEDLERCKKVYEEEMKPYQTEYGLDVTYLSKKEKEQLVNKRNCLITQMKTYEMLLED